MFKVQHERLNARPHDELQTTTCCKTADVVRQKNKWRRGLTAAAHTVFGGECVDHAPALLRGTPQLYFYALPEVAIPEMHNSEFRRSLLLNLLRITNPKPSEQHLTTLSVRRNPTSWTCSQSEILNPESNTSQQCLQEGLRKRNLFTTTYAHVITQKRTQKIRLRRQEERVERKDRAGVQSSRAG
jgi:hypothetical protein